MDFEQIGMRIKACRKQKHLTQEKLAECLDVSSHYIYELERGVKTMSLYTLSTIFRLVLRFRVTICSMARTILIQTRFPKTPCP